MKINEDPRLPIPGTPHFEKSLYQRLYSLFRGIAMQVNGMASGSVSFIDSAATAPPTTGKHYQGDVIRNSAPVVVGGYIVTGWICVESGEPGIWKEMRCQTV